MGSPIISLKQDQRTGKLTKGIVRDILTKSTTHPHGIKVRLENGIVGRVKIIHGGVSFLDKLICRLNLERVLGRLSDQYFKERPIQEGG